MRDPLSVNVCEFAKQMLEIHGRIRASNFPEVRDALYLGKEDRSEVQYVATGENGRRGRYCLRLALEGQLRLLCQRCLGEYEFRLQHDSMFEIVALEADLPEDDDDEIDYLVADTELNVGQLIGQELLLGLPLAPKHENEHCSSTDDALTEQKPNPFSVLQGLKSNIG